jgi:glutamate--cysteine ligase catalytic subunit
VGFVHIGVDALLARHYAHLFIRDPLVVFRELLHVDDSVSSDHFENIQSTNWQTMRFKPPTPGSNIGWRVEFRSMDIQLTDHENSCFATFIVLLARVINHFDLNLYIPLSKLDENMARAQKRDAISTQKFWFRKDLSRGKLSLI